MKNYKHNKKDFKTLIVFERVPVRVYIFASLRGHFYGAAKFILQIYYQMEIILLPCVGILPSFMIIWPSWCFQAPAANWPLK